MPKEANLNNYAGVVHSVLSSADLIRAPLSGGSMQLPDPETSPPILSIPARQDQTPSSIEQVELKFDHPSSLSKPRQS